MNGPLVSAAGLAAPMSAEQMREHVSAIQRLMEAVMKEGEHYGRVPGSRKPSLWKPGAEKLCVAFHIEPSFVIEDLSTDKAYRYRVKCVGTHQPSGVKLGEGMGACSSSEQKFGWRRASDAEFGATSGKRRRYKYRFDPETQRLVEVKQVRVDHEDLENVILKMACKRAHVAMTLNVTAASDIFTQDVEDLAEHLEAEGADTRPRGRTVRVPRAKSEQKTMAGPANSGPGAREPLEESAPRLSEAQQRILRARMARKSVAKEDLVGRFGCSLEAIAAERFGEVAAWIRRQGRG